MIWLLPLATTALALDPLLLDEGGVAVATQAELWPSPPRGQDPASLLQGEGDFRQVQTQEIALGPLIDEVWVRFTVENPTPERLWVLEVDYAPLDELTVWIDGEPPLRAGDLVPPAERALDTPRPAFPLYVDPGSTRTVLLHARNTGTMRLPIAVLPQAVHAANQTRAMAFSGGLLAVSLVMGLYQLLLFPYVRDRSLLYYAVFAGLGGATFAAMSGDATWLFLSRWPVLAHVAPNSLSIVASVAGLLFTASFLEIRQRQPRLYLGYWGLIAGLVLSLVLWPIAGYRAANLVSTFMQFLFVPAILWGSLWGVVQGFAPARTFLAAWAPFLVGFAAFLAKQDGLLPATALTEVGAPLSFLLGLTLLSTALGQRFRAIRDELHQARAMAEATRRLTAYFPEPLVRRVLSSPHAVEPRTERVQATILFSDLQGFTTLSDQRPAEVVDTVLNEYLAAMTAVIDANHGTLDKVMGDGLMVLLGAPEAMAVEEQAHRAVRMAVQMHQRLAQLNSDWSARGLIEPLSLRIGIHTDLVTIGNFGSSQLMSYTAIGRGVNLASRLEGQATPGRILVSERVYGLTHTAYPYAPLHPESLRGLEGDQQVAELDPGAVSA